MQSLKPLIDKILHLKGINYAWRVIQRFLNDNGPRNAAALTYTSLFAVVPMLMMVYSMLAALPIFRGVGDELQVMLFDHLVPTTGAVIQDYMGGFAKQARQMTLVGAIVLIVTAGMMIVSIEKAFNHIWRVEKPRRGLQALLIYWTVLTLGPLLLGAGIVLSSYLTTLPLLNKLDGVTGGGVATLWKFLPFMFSILAFTMLYWAVPHCKVRFRDAAVGGFAMAFLFEVAKKTFTWFVSNFPSYEFIYGAFAAFPLFLMWIYISWIMILLCAQWVAVRGLPKGYSTKDKLEPSLQILIILRELWQAFAKAEGVEESYLRSLTGSENAEQWQTNIEWMQANQWIVFDREREVWLPGRDFNRISFASWLQALPWRIPKVDTWPDTLDNLKELREVLVELQQQEALSLAAPLGQYVTANTGELKP
ncbi:MAG: YihY family inner membrane protein [Pseudomonadaceae bacterium]|nr:YihY family inner membrane protein [Pseudomonadaceae bacterium]